MWGCLREFARPAAGNLWRWFRESRQSELMVVFGEDLAALVGLVIALVFIGLAMAPATRSGTTAARAPASACS